MRIFYSRLNGDYRDKPVISKFDDKIIRPYTPKEYARFKGPDNFEFAGSSRDIYKQVDTAITVPM